MASATTDGPGFLEHARYGKDKVRVLRVVREGSWHQIVEYNVCALVEGEIDVSYTQADNGVVVATDSIKNITYYLAKTSPHVLHPERFALHLGTFLLARYAHLRKAFVTVEQLRWARVAVPGAGAAEATEDHAHSFWRDGDEKRVASVEVDASKGLDNIIAKVTSGISDLLVLKSTGSAFYGFVKDEYTTLAPATDRVFSTAVDARWEFAPIAVLNPLPPSIASDAKALSAFVKDTLAYKFELGKEESGAGTPWDGVNIAVAARKATLEVFATDDSASATLYKMGQRVLAEAPHVQRVSYGLPNKHYVPVDLRWAGLDNVGDGGAGAEVFVPLAAPSGLISATIARR
ncbi:uricase [Obba rivulosa]|uniref:Uricase n=1 Tax=Obba rivulosa TaxID=1052685 RepID=A0A8E2DHP9_9APHY|nr:uricase [Obba rivulosa]